MNSILGTSEGVRHRWKSSNAEARRAAAIAFAAQGASVAATFTTVPAVQAVHGLSPLVTTAMMVSVVLAAGAGSFVGLAIVRLVGTVTAMRWAIAAIAAALLLIGWAPGQVTVIVAYVLFGLALGGVDVAVNTRAADVERQYERSVFASFYAAASVGGILAALLTAAAAHLEWSVAHILTAHAGLVVTMLLIIRDHPEAPAAPGTTTGVPAAPHPVEGRTLWGRLLPFGLVILVAYVIDSTISAWSTVYLHQTLRAPLSVAPLAYAAYQVGVVSGRTCADRLIHKIGPPAVVRVATVLAAVALAALAAAPGWLFAAAASALAGLGVSVLTPLCLAAAGRLRPSAAESVLARLNLFNYLGVVVGGVVAGVLGSVGYFRVAYAVPAVLAALLVATARFFARSARSSP